MLPRSRQRHQLGQALRGKPVGPRGGHPIGPGDRQRHPPGGSALADEHPLAPRTALLEDNHQALAQERVEGVGDDDRV